ncbi:hypothetical protein K456DRAFT_952030 [Colletotrichum gloeosporioides 23]|nr:hypothetical protein K456DRAFT_952030 [Colletotrichum gloeosporioides 23]
MLPRHREDTNSFVVPVCCYCCVGMLGRGRGRGGGYGKDRGKLTSDRLRPAVGSLLLVPWADAIFFLVGRADVNKSAACEDRGGSEIPRARVRHILDQRPPSCCYC